MKDKLRILFLSGCDCTVSGMAVGILRLLGDAADAGSCAAVESNAADPGTVDIFKEIGIDPAPPDCRTVAELSEEPFDLVITLDDHAREYWHKDTSLRPNGSLEKSPLFVDAPVHLHWPVGTLPDEQDHNRRVAACRRLRDTLQSKIRTFLEDGYLAALAVQRENTRRLLDSLGEGVIIHDDRRRILVFNKEAERITGLRREDVLGRDCHEIFGPDGICGAQCTFRRKDSGAPRDREYQVKFAAPDGGSKLLRMSLTPWEPVPGEPGGVIAAMHDVTELSDLRWQAREKRSFHGMVGVSPVMQEVFETIRQVVASDYPVVITGESGTGKELVANAIHRESRRAGGPFVPINCGALPENILESELFGHMRGAFTGAIRDKKGRFELADGGTLFLDEVGELTPAFQVKLLRVLQEKQFERVGGEHSIRVDVRIISATNRELRQLVNEGKFREDLYYRLAVVPINLPPLRERREDIPHLVAQILSEIRREMDKKSLSISDAVMDHLWHYSWPGNVRELINVLRFSAVRCEGDRILPRHLPFEVRQAQGKAPLPSLVPRSDTSPAPASARRRGILAADAVRQALVQAGGNKVKAARILGVGRATLYRFLTAYPLSE